MKQKTWLRALIFLAFLLLLAACGTSEDETTNEPPAEEPESTEGSSGGILAGAVNPTIEQVDEDTYRYTLKNQTEQVKTFTFTSGQRFDFSLTTKDGEQAFLFSSVASFTQNMGEESIKQAEELNYEFDVPEADLEPGTYTLEVWLTPEEGPAFEAQAEHVVE
ncbi:BsuPI-related putative proteinase inhibitor [Planomicrobium sp. CPCC 101079]|uniref:BsuPI-related putative proteinase inhibitor n=1 Tax=Planomicrobium sp. CPCC 101079 TaxID=2599618 RepID=UPI0011B85E2B|nr:BsuPI-related putative proteinase inhibitor [Planomicrobium sp. CPCC 101079]TWT01485.1 intracellular proteinase inhibitor (BsuPI) [Planomicrobium sp. CPCC 101079]